VIGPDGNVEMYSPGAGLVALFSERLSIAVGVAQPLVPEAGSLVLIGHIVVTSHHTVRAKCLLHLVPHPKSATDRLCAAASVSEYKNGFFGRGG
jgi:hypothetical protein